MSVHGLTVERVRELLEFRADTGIFTWKYSTNRRILIGSVAGCDLDSGYVAIKVDLHRYFAHRLAWLFSYGCWPLGEIDHINGVRSDNRLCNLRSVTHSVNMQNLFGPIKSNKTSGLLGVSFNSDRGKWVAQIRANGVTKFLGRFNTDEAARVAYMRAKAMLHDTSTYAATWRHGDKGKRA